MASVSVQIATNLVMYYCTVLVTRRAYHPVALEASDSGLNADGCKRVLHQPLAFSCGLVDGAASYSTPCTWPSIDVVSALGLVLAHH